jgi:hypothetical protein
MDAMTSFFIQYAGLRSLENDDINAFVNKYNSHPVVSGILTPCCMKTPSIITIQNQVIILMDNPIFLNISRHKNPKIAYITVKKIKKCLTFDYRCVRNILLLNDKNLKRRYLWPF